jgi:(1->4)-alpha-D-glucan 1-alpha-D-glucosylmutase
VPLAVSGRYRDKIVAYGRNAGDRWAVTLVPRFLVTLVEEGEDPLGRDVWQDTQVALQDGFPRLWRNVLTGELIHARDALLIGEVLRSLPVALLVSNA